MVFRKSFYAGIFLVAASTLLLEITLTKIFSVIHSHYSAFLIVSTALFGYGISGVVLSVSKRLETISRERLLFVSSLLFGITTVVSYRLMLSVPLVIGDVFSSSVQMFYLAAAYLLLALPFFFSGLAIGVLLTGYTDRVNTLYFADLTGAAIGCFAIVLIIPFLGGSGTLLFAAIVGCLSALAFARTKSEFLLPFLSIAVIAILIPRAEQYFPSATKSQKRHFANSIRGGTLYTGWSPAGRIDVVASAQQVYTIWIDGGTCQSFMRGWDGKKKMMGRVGDLTERALELPYKFLKDPNVLIIGPGGGTEVLSTLKFNPSKITGVELDPLITKIVSGHFSDFIGHLYSRPNVKLVNEEGRSFVRRSHELYDIIQQKSNTHPMTVASGALNLTESYLLTKEAFSEYLDHLKPNGYLTIARHGGARLLIMAAELLQEREIPDYWNRMILMSESSRRQVLLLKNSPITPKELAFYERFMKKTRMEALYTPKMYGREDHLFARIMDEASRKQIIEEAPFLLEAPTDDKPFMEHFFRIRSLFSEDMRQKLNEPFWTAAQLESFAVGDASYPDLSLYVILLEAILLSSVFILYPLFRMKRSGVAITGAWRLLGYFFCLGVGFIFVEIVFIQKYILFIGYPVYAVATIIFALLLAAGAGSYFSSRISPDPIRALRVAVLAILVMLIFQISVVPMLFRQFLSAPFSVRLALSILFLLPAGFFMGMPFPIGLTITSKTAPSFLPWAWGMNGYATVVGSVLSVILALQFGFRTVLIIAGGIYLIALLLFRTFPASARVATS